MTTPIYTDPYVEIQQLKSSRDFWRAVAGSFFVLLIVAVYTILMIIE